MDFDPLPASLADKPTCEAVEPAMSSPGTPNRPKSMALTPKMEQLRSTAPADYPCFKETGFYKPTDGCQPNVAASSHPRHQTARTHQSGRLWLLLVWRMKTRCPSPSLAAGSHPSHPPSALVRHHHMRQAPSRQARSRRKKRSLAGRELASCMARIQPTTRQVATVSRRTDVWWHGIRIMRLFWLLVLRK